MGTFRDCSWTRFVAWRHRPRTACRTLSGQNYRLEHAVQLDLNCPPSRRGGVVDGIMSGERSSSHGPCSTSCGMGRADPASASGMGSAGLAELGLRCAGEVATGEGSGDITGASWALLGESTDT